MVVRLCASMIKPIKILYVLNLNILLRINFHECRPLEAYFFFFSRIKSIVRKKIRSTFSCFHLACLSIFTLLSDGTCAMRLRLIHSRVNSESMQRISIIMPDVISIFCRRSRRSLTCRAVSRGETLSYILGYRVNLSNAKFFSREAKYPNSLQKYLYIYMPYESTI